MRSCSAFQTVACVENTIASSHHRYKTLSDALQCMMPSYSRTKKCCPAFLQLYRIALPCKDFVSMILVRALACHELSEISGPLPMQWAALSQATPSKAKKVTFICIHSRQRPDPCSIKPEMSGSLPVGFFCWAAEDPCTEVRPMIETYFHGYKQQHHDICYTAMWCRMRLSALARLHCRWAALRHSTRTSKQHAEALSMHKPQDHGFCQSG